MRIERKNPSDLFDSVQYGFSQVVVAHKSCVIAVSGQVAWDADEQLIGGNDLFDQATAALSNLRRALSSVGADMSHVISLRIYVVDYKPDNAEAISRALKNAFANGQEPAATWIGISSLANPEMRIEIEAMAALAETDESTGTAT